jgi:RNA polymerase sigma factor (sigma-70 family)
MAENALTMVLRHLRRLVQRDGTVGCTDGRLLGQFIAAHDEKAFAALVQRHGPGVLGLCRRVLDNDHDAEDAFQATFLVLARKAMSVRNQAVLGSWLCGVAYKIAVRLRANAARRRYHEQQAGASAMMSTDPASIDPELRSVFDEVLQSLPQRYRLPVVLCYLEGKSCEEAAQQLQRPIGTIKSRLARARDLLRQRLAHRGVTVAPAALAATLSAAATPAAVSAALAENTVRAALGFLGASTAAPEAVVNLAEGALRIMARTRWKIAVALSFVLCAAGLGTGLLLVGAETDKPPARAEAARPVGDQKAQSARDAFGNLLPPGALARLGRVPRFWHAVTLALAPDGKTMASTGYLSGAVYLWDLTTGQEIRHWQVGGFERLAFSADGRLLATGLYDGSANSIHIWDVNTAKQQCLIKTGGWSFALSHDGKTLATGDNNQVTLWDIPSQKLIRRFAVNGSSDTLAFSPDGKRLAVGGRADWRAVGGDGNVSVHEVAAGKQLQQHKVNGPLSEVHSLAFAPDSKTVVWASGNDAPRAFVRNFQAGFLAVTEGPRLPLPPGQLGKLRGFSPNGRVLVLATDDHTLSVWDWTAGQVLRAFNDGPGRVQLVERQAGKVRKTINEVHWSRVRVADHGNVLADQSGAELAIWDVPTGKRRHPPRPPALHVAAFGPDSRTVVASSDELVHFCDPATGKEIRKVEVGGRLLAVSPDGKSLVVARQPGAALCDAATGQELAPLLVKPAGAKEARLEAPHLAAFSQDGKRLVLVHRASFPDAKDAKASSVRNAIAVWDVPGKRELWSKIEGWSHSVTSLCFAADGKAVAMGFDGEAILWDVETGKERHRWKNDEKIGPIPITPFVALAPDGRSAALATGSAIRFWEPATGRERKVAGFTGPLAYSPDGKMLAVLPDKDRDTICVLETATGKERFRFRGHQGAVRTLAFSPDGKALASDSDDTTVLIWDVSGTEIRAD